MIRLNQKRNGVSPILGSIILFTSLLILSTIIMTSILGVSPSTVEEKPSAQFTYHFSEQAVIIQYEKGKPIQSDQVSIDAGTNVRTVSSDWNDGIITANDRIVLEKTKGSWSKEKIRATWEYEGRSALLFEATAP